MPDQGVSVTVRQRCLHAHAVSLGP